MRARMRPFSLKSGSTRWFGPVLLALVPLWGVGALMRGLWTPDEHGSPTSIGA